MRFPLLLRLGSSVAIGILVLPSTHAISLDDTREAVFRELGAPVGEVESQGMTLLVYSRGEIRLRDGRVSAINLMSDEEIAARIEAREATDAHDEAARAERLARLEAEGKALYARKTADPDFLLLPPSQQLAFWRSFASRYPMIPIMPELNALSDRIEQERLMRGMVQSGDDRLAELEARVTAAEERALDAERQANALYYFGRRSTGYYHGSSLIIHGHPYRPRRPTAGPHPVPHADPMGEARAQVMGEYEAARSAAYSGRTP